MNGLLETPEELNMTPAGKTCQVHGELVKVLVRMNRKLNLLIGTALVFGGAVLGKDLLAALLARLGG